MLNKKQLLKKITNKYLKSNEFNGLLLDGIDDAKDEIYKVLIDLIDDDSICIIYGDYHLNPFILAFPPEDTRIQKLKLKEICLSSKSNIACIYPSSSQLMKIVDPKKYKKEPFALKQAYGEASFTLYYFDLSVFQNYVNDPRYIFKNNDIVGHIWVRDNTNMRKRDEIFLDHFGFAYNRRKRRVVCVPLHYLAILPEVHQMYWHSKCLKGKYLPHSDYYRSQIIGDFPEGASVFDMLLIEMIEINNVCDAMGRPHLFKNTYNVFDNVPRPEGFQFLLLPTLNEYNKFLHTLDKLLSDNINKKFFRKEIPFEIDIKRKDGKIEVRHKGSLTLLADWLTKYYKPKRKADVKKILTDLFAIRDYRNPIAHSLQENEYNEALIKEQKKVIKKAYRCILYLRIILSTHPLAKTYKYPDYLENLKVWL